MRVLLTVLFLSPSVAFADSARQQLQDSAPESARQTHVPAVPADQAVPGAVDQRLPNGTAEGIGLSHSGNPFDIPDFSLAEIAGILSKAGGTHYRPHCPINEAVPEISAETLARLKKAATDPAVLEAMTADLAVNGRWDRMDGLVSNFSGAGIKLILVVGAGYRKEAPLFVMPDGAKDHVSPDRIGRDVYIAMARWIAGAAVRRYGDRVEFWQVENEINIARMVSFIGWRVSERSWGDRKFLDALITGLAQTVHAEGQRAGRPLKTTHNFATDGTAWKDEVNAHAVPEETSQPVDVVKDIGVFAVHDLDIVGLDLYANYFTGWPMQDAKEGRVVADAVAAAGGRPVWVLEAGFPRAPGLKGFTEARQAEYFRKLFDASYRAGAKVILAFGWFWNPHGWYTDDPKPKPWWSPQACEQYWSPISVKHNPDGSKNVHFGPALDEMKSASDRWLKK